MPDNQIDPPRTLSQMEAIARLIHRKKTAALGTLHEGAPSVSMAPFVWQAASVFFVIHVSRLAAHTGDMLADPRVSLLITAPETDDVPAQALPRLTIQGVARPIAQDSEAYTASKAAYLARFPSAQAIFQLGDFMLIGIVPSAVRYIAGFGQAYNLTPDCLPGIRS